MKLGDAMSKWAADITNDPDRDFQLYVELMHDEKYKGRLYMDETGTLQLRIYEEPAPIPVEWLLGIIDRFRADVRAGRQERQ